MQRKGRKWRDPLFPGQSSFHPQSVAFCCLFFLFSMGTPFFQKPYLLHGIWQQACVGGFSKHQVAKEIEGETNRDVYVCVICICVGPVNNKTVTLMYPGLLLEQTKQYLHGDFVLSPVSLASTVLFCNQLVVQCFHFMHRSNAFT